MGDITNIQDRISEDCGKDDLAFYNKLSNVLMLAIMFLVFSAVLIFILTKRQIRRLLQLHDLESGQKDAQKDGQKDALIRVMNYQLAHYLQKKNASVPSINPEEQIDEIK